MFKGDDVHPGPEIACVWPFIRFAYSGICGAVSTAKAERPLYHASTEMYFPVSPDIALSVHGPKGRLSFQKIGRDVTRTPIRPGWR